MHIRNAKLNVKKEVKEVKKEKKTLPKSFYNYIDSASNQTPQYFGTNFTC